jgi:hypothetical protein
MPKLVVSVGLWKLRPAPRHHLDDFAPAQLLPRSFPWCRIVPVSRQPRNVIPGEWTEVRVDRRLPSRCEQAGRSLCRARRREDAGGLRAEEPARSVSVPSAGSHCLNGLPVHRSVVVAGRRGQANGGEPAVRIGDKTEWPAFMVASRSRRGGRHLTLSRVIIKGHTGTLRARAGCCPEVGSRRVVPRASSLQAGPASSGMPPSG